MPTTPTDIATEGNREETPLSTPAAEAINGAFFTGLEALEELKQRTHLVVEQFAKAGKLLRERRRMFGDKKPGRNAGPYVRGGGWLEWLAHNCPDISRRTAARLMSISEAYDAAVERGGHLALPQNLTSIRGIQEAIRAHVDQENDQDANIPTHPRPPTKADGIFSKLWRVIKGKDTPEPEKIAFLRHTSNAVQTCRECGWELPPPFPKDAIEIGFETIED